MSERDPLESTLRSWFQSEASERAPDRLRDRVDARLDLAEQGKGQVARTFGWGRVAVALAAVLLLGFIIGAGLVGGPRAQQNPPPPPTPTLAGTPLAVLPSSSLAPMPEGPVLPAGSNESESFTPGVSFIVPAGWTKVADLPVFVGLVPPGAGSVVQANNGSVIFDGIYIMSDPVAGPADGSDLAEPGVGHDAKALSEWLSGRPQLVATRPKAIAIGELTGFSVDYSVASVAGGLCGVRCVNVFNLADGIQSGILEGEKDRAILLDRPDGGTLLILIEDADGKDVDALRTIAAPIVDSMRLLPAPSPGPSARS